MFCILPFRVASARISNADVRLLPRSTLFSAIEPAESWTHKDLAFTDKEGNIHISSALPAELRVQATEHELNHSMRRKGYQPYLDFLISVPRVVDLFSDAGAKLFYGAADHRGIDVTKPLSDEEKVIISDEIASLVRGSEMSGRVDDVLEDCLEAFVDYDAFAAELAAIHDRYVSEIGRGQAPQGALPDALPPQSYAEALRRLAAEGGRLTPEQRALLDEWNRRFPEMRMGDDEFLAR